MGWFPLFAEYFKKDHLLLTPAEQLYFWYLVSEFNLRGKFFKSDLEIAITLAIKEKTVRRGRTKLKEMGLIEVKSGTKTNRNQFIATRYLHVKYATTNEKGFFAQTPRHTFDAMLDLLRRSSLKAGDVVVYICLFYWYWRNRGKKEPRDNFFITKNELRSLTGLNDAPNRLTRICEAFTFTAGNHLFEYQLNHHEIFFRNWTWLADPDENEHNRRNADRYIMEIKELVAREKNLKEMKRQQKISKTVLLPFEFFQESYKKKYGRLPDHNSSIKEEFHKVEKAHVAAIYRAITWYFSAEVVPNGTGAKTRTMKNFTTQIKEILELSDKFEFV